MEFHNTWTRTLLIYCGCLVFSFRLAPTPHPTPTNSDPNLTPFPELFPLDVPLTIPLHQVWTSLFEANPNPI